MSKFYQMSIKGHSSSFTNNNSSDNELSTFTSLIFPRHCDGLPVLPHKSFSGDLLYEKYFPILGEKEVEQG